MNVKKWIALLLLCTFGVMAQAAGEPKIVEHQERIWSEPPSLEIMGKVVYLDRAAKKITIDGTTYDVTENLEAWVGEGLGAERVSLENLPQNIAGKTVRYAVEGTEVIQMVIRMTTGKSGG